MDESIITERPDVTTRAHVVKAEWFWTSVQKEVSLDEKDYLFEDVRIKNFQKISPFLLDFLNF